MDYVFYLCKKVEDMKIINKFADENHFLSNFAFCKIKYEGIEYPSTEHAYQAAKSLDFDVRLKISKLDSPGKSKQAGQKIQIREDWDSVKNQIMYDICKIKFSQRYFKMRLLATDDAYLEEGNHWHDNFWGVCYCGNCPIHKRQPKDNQNHLGIVLMRIRSEFQINP